jgi:hypothetical protein
MDRINDHGKTKTKIERDRAFRITLVITIPIMPNDLQNAMKYEYNEGSKDKDTK